MIAPRLLLRWLAIACLAAGVLRVAWPWISGPWPPAPNLTGCDPAVAKAIREARANALRAPRAALAWGQLGMTLAVHDFNAEAIGCYARAEQLDPREARWPYLAGFALLKRDQQRALPKLKQGVDLCRGDCDAQWLVLAATQFELGLYSDADASYRRALEHNAGNLRALLGLGKIALAQGRLDEAVSQLSHCSTNRATARNASLLLVTAYARLGNQPAAEKAREQAAQLPEDPADFDSYAEEAGRFRTGLEAGLQQADVLYRRGSTAEAITLLERVVKDYPKSDTGWLALGRARAKARNPAGAEEAWRRALSLRPGDKEVEKLIKGLKQPSATP